MQENGSTTLHPFDYRLGFLRKILLGKTLSFFFYKGVLNGFVCVVYCLSQVPNVMNRMNFMNLKPNYQKMKSTNTMTNLV